jgi:hypothetical protein
MRKVLLTALLVGLLALPVLAQFPLGGMMGRAMDGTALLGNEGVQKELKLNDEQKKAITAANKARQEAFRAAFQDKDRDAMQKATQDFTKAMGKVKDGLSKTQLARLTEIEIQVAVQMNQPSIFKNERVQKALKLTDKQKDAVKEALSDLDKDVKEMMEDAKGDREKMVAAFKKMQTMGKDSFTKITKTLSEAQKETWKKMQGEKFELKLGGFGGKGKKKDDF